MQDIQNEQHPDQPLLEGMPLRPHLLVSHLREAGVTQGGPRMSLRERRRTSSAGILAAASRLLWTILVRRMVHRAQGARFCFE